MLALREGIIASLLLGTTATNVVSSGQESFRQEPGHYVFPEQRDNNFKFSVMMKFQKPDAWFRNSIGIYFANEENIATHGYIFYRNINLEGDVVANKNVTFDASISDKATNKIPDDAKKIGFFLIPDGGHDEDTNTLLRDDTKVIFRNSTKEYTPKPGLPALKRKPLAPFVENENEDYDELTGNGSYNKYPAFFTNRLLNPDCISRLKQESGSLEDTLFWEDGDDSTYNDAIVEIEVEGLTFEPVKFEEKCKYFEAFEFDEGLEYNSLHEDKEASDEDYQVKCSKPTNTSETPTMAANTSETPTMAANTSETPTMAGKTTETSTTARQHCHDEKKNKTKEAGDSEQKTKRPRNLKFLDNTNRDTQREG